MFKNRPLILLIISGLLFPTDIACTNSQYFFHAISLAIGFSGGALCMLPKIRNLIFRKKQAQQESEFAQEERTREHAWYQNELKKYQNQMHEKISEKADVEKMIAEYEHQIKQLKEKQELSLEKLELKAFNAEKLADKNGAALQSAEEKVQNGQRIISNLNQIVRSLNETIQTNDQKIAVLTERIAELTRLNQQRTEQRNLDAGVAQPFGNPGNSPFIDPFANFPFPHSQPSTSNSNANQAEIILLKNQLKEKEEYAKKLFNNLNSATSRIAAYEDGITRSNIRYLNRIEPEQKDLLVRVFGQFLKTDTCGICAAENQNIFACKSPANQKILHSLQANRDSAEANNQESKEEAHGCCLQCIEKIGAQPVNSPDRGPDPIRCPHCRFQG